MARASGFLKEVVGKEDVAGAGPGPVGVRHPEEHQQVVVAERSIGGGDQGHPPAMNPSAAGAGAGWGTPSERAAVQQPPDAPGEATRPAGERPGGRGGGRLPERLEHGFLDLAVSLRRRFEARFQEVEKRLDCRLESRARIPYRAQSPGSGSERPESGGGRLERLRPPEPSLDDRRAVHRCLLPTDFFRPPTQPDGEGGEGLRIVGVPESRVQRLFLEDVGRPRGDASEFGSEEERVAQQVQADGDPAGVGPELQDVGNGGDPGFAAQAGVEMRVEGDPQPRQQRLGALKVPVGLLGHERAAFVAPKGLSAVLPEPQNHRSRRPDLRLPVGHAADEAATRLGDVDRRRGWSLLRRAGLQRRCRHRRRRERGGEEGGLLPRRRRERAGSRGTTRHRGLPNFQPAGQQSAGEGGRRIGGKRPPEATRRQQRGEQPGIREAQGVFADGEYPRSEQHRTERRRESEQAVAERTRINPRNRFERFLVAAMGSPQPAGERQEAQRPLVRFLRFGKPPCGPLGESLERRPVRPEVGVLRLLVQEGEQRIGELRRIPGRDFGLGGSREQRLFDQDFAGQPRRHPEWGLEIAGEIAQRAVCHSYPGKGGTLKKPGAQHPVKHPGGPRSGNDDLEALAGRAGDLPGIRRRGFPDDPFPEFPPVWEPPDLDPARRLGFRQGRTHQSQDHTEGARHFPPPWECPRASRWRRRAAICRDARAQLL